MNKQSVPVLDLSFSCDSIRSGRNLDKRPAAPQNYPDNASIASSSHRTAPLPPKFDHVAVPSTGRQSSAGTARYDENQWAGSFTPYHENMTGRRLQEREFSDIGHIRQLIESRLPENTNGVPTKEPVTSRPGSASARIAKRVAFGARLLLISDCDSLRDFTGFFWPEDSTLAIYEFRGLSKTAGRIPPRVLPFVTRGQYKHAGGIRAGQSVGLCDITEGRDIVLSVSDHAAALNDALRQRSIFVIRITYVDVAQKRSILLQDVRISDHDEVLAKLHAPQTPEEAESRALLFNIRTKVKKTLRTRGIPALLNMRHELKISVKVPQEQMNETSYQKACLTREQIMGILERFNIRLSPDEINRYCALLDTDQNGTVDFGEFVRGLIGGMSETRHLFVRRAWAKMDPSKKGLLSIATIRKFYSARNHPDVVSGDRKEQEIVSAFTAMLTLPGRYVRIGAKNSEEDIVIGFGEFETYYEGLSLAVETDEDFLQILKDTWGNLSN